MGSFARLFGNELHKNRIAEAIKSGTLPHALLIDGPAGSGKRTFAKEIAAALNCEGGGSLPCYECTACKRIADGSFTDVKTLRRAKDKATVGVIEIRDFKADMFLSATESEHKVYIIEEAHKMTKQAQNALLKILEEPPANVVIILLASGVESILTTIKSRVQYIPMERFPKDRLGEYLVRISPEARGIKMMSEEDFSALLVSADGIIGRAIALSGGKERQANEERRAEILAIVGAFRRRASFSSLYEAMKAIPSKRDEFTEMAELLISAVSDLICSKKSEEFSPLFFTSPSAARTLSEDISTERLISIYRALTGAIDDCLRNANMGLVTSNLMMKIRSS